MKFGHRILIYESDFELNLLKFGKTFCNPQKQNGCIFHFSKLQFGDWKVAFDQRFKSCFWDIWRHLKTIPFINQEHWENYLKKLESELDKKLKNFEFKDFVLSKFRLVHLLELISYNSIMHTPHLRPIYE